MGQGEEWRGRGEGLQREGWGGVVQVNTHSAQQINSPRVIRRGKFALRTLLCLNVLLKVVVVVEVKDGMGKTGASSDGEGGGGCGGVLIVLVVVFVVMVVMIVIVVKCGDF